MKKTIQFIKTTRQVDLILKQQLILLKGGGKIKKKGTQSKLSCFSSFATKESKTFIKIHL